MKRRVRMAQPDFLISITVMSRLASWVILWKFWLSPFGGKRFDLNWVKLCANSKNCNAGRKPYDSIFMFKIIVLQSLYKLSDDQTELQIKGRLSYMHFLDRGFEDTEPGAKTLWLFRDTLSNKNIIDKLFLKFDWHLDHKDLFARQG